MSAGRSAVRTVPKHLCRKAVAFRSVTARPVSLPLATPSASKRWGGSLPPRNESFTRLAPQHIEAIRSLLSSPSSLISTLDNTASPEDLAAFNNDWMGKYSGKSPVVVKPKTTEEVGKVMKYCYDNDIAIVPQGGNTGLVGTSYFNPRCLSDNQADQTQYTTNSYCPPPT